MVRFNVNWSEDVQLGWIHQGVTELLSNAEKLGMDPPLVVNKAGSLCLSTIDPGTGSFALATPDALAGVLRPTCVPYREKPDGSGGVTEVVQPALSRALMKMYIESRNWPEVPVARRIMRAPVIRPDFTVCWDTGWDEETHTWVLPGLKRDDYFVHGGFRLDRIFKYFPFTDHRLGMDVAAVALGSLLSTALDGPVPGLIVGAQSPASGKSELAKLCSVMGNGTYNDGMSSWSHHEELEKTIISLVMEDARVAIFDNIRGKIESDMLEMVITSRTAKARKFYSQMTRKLESNTVWIMTGNGASASEDMIRRCMVVMLDKENTTRDPSVEWEQKVSDDIQAFEAAFVTYMCHLVEEWRAAGCPPWSKVPYSGFEQWSSVTGGILEHNGYTGFLECRDEAADDAIHRDTEDEYAVIEAVYEVMEGVEEWTTKDLWLAVNDDLAAIDQPARKYLKKWMETGGAIGSGKRKFSSVGVGKALSGVLGKRYDGFDFILEKSRKSQGVVYNFRDVNVRKTE